MSKTPDYRTLFPDGHLLYDQCQQPTVLQTFFTLIEMIVLSQCRQSPLNFEPACPRVQCVQSSDHLRRLEDVYDFIVVGGGVAGAVIAARLVENPNIRVLLIEAGGEEPQTSFIPAFLNRPNNTDFDWKYKTEPQKNACKSNGGVCLWPRGKMLCGTACLSGLMYTRGHRSIYDKWAVDNPGWSYNDVMKYFKKSEWNTEPRGAIEPEYHGFNGPLRISHFPHMPHLGRNILDAVKELNFRIGDVNGHNPEAFTVAPIMVDNGMFSSPRKRYLDPVLRNKNLRVLIETYVTRVLFDESGRRATGVEVQDKWNNMHKFRATKEVILTAGVVGSPQILMLSGVGPEKDLKKLGIKVIRNLPVGGNLHYHVGFTFNVHLENDDNDNIDQAAMHEYHEKRTGPLSSTGLTQITGFVASKYAQPGVPDIQFFMDSERGMKCRDRNTPNELTFRPVYLLSKCRGTLKLRSTRPKDPPSINPNYLCNDVEIEALFEAEKIAYKLTQTRALKPKVKRYNCRPHEKCNHLLGKDKKDKDEHAYWRCVITQYTNGENHHAGTCKMGSSQDKAAVVDHELRVHGIKNLRIADASIMPTPINCNTIAPVVMIAEKASDMIKYVWN